jgi:hypothetical protein
MRYRSSIRRIVADAAAVCLLAILILAASPGVGECPYEYWRALPPMLLSSGCDT